VTFHRDGAVLHVLDVSDTRASASNHVFATIPIRDEDRDTLSLDLNEGFDTVRSEEDRTGEDYYGRIDRHDETTFRLFERKAVSVSYHDAMLVFDQERAPRAGGWKNRWESSSPTSPISKGALVIDGRTSPTTPGRRHCSAALHAPPTPTTPSARRAGRRSAPTSSATARSSRRTRWSRSRRRSGPWMPPSCRSP
jgi:hypothetical protein